LADLARLRRLIDEATSHARLGRRWGVQVPSFLRRRDVALAEFCFGEMMRHKRRFDAAVRELVRMLREDPVLRRLVRGDRS